MKLLKWTPYGGKLRFVRGPDRLLRLRLRHRKRPGGGRRLRLLDELRWLRGAPVMWLLLGVTDFLRDLERKLQFDCIAWCLLYHSVMEGTPGDGATSVLQSGSTITILSWFPTFSS